MQHMNILNYKRDKTKLFKLQGAENFLKNLLKINKQNEKKVRRKEYLFKNMSKLDRDIYENDHLAKELERE